MCTITPTDANTILERANPGNFRRISDAQRARYVRTMREDGWQLTHQGIAFDTDGMLIDGQHRLRAAVISKTTITVMVFVGMDPTIVRFIDEGKARTANDLLKHLGIHTNTTVAPAVRLILAYKSDNPTTTYRTGITNSDIAAFVENHPDIVDYARRGGSLQGTPRGDGLGTVNGVAMAVMAYLLETTNAADPDTIETFLFGLATGFQRKATPGPSTEGRLLIATTDPRNRVRTWLHGTTDRTGLLKNRVPALTQLMLIITAWNHMCAGERPRRLAYDPAALTYPQPAPATAALRRVLA
jgi:hypothetical protein